jgi:Ni/Fe-hydrogenase subunit HybB-like protein
MGVMGAIVLLILAPLNIILDLAQPQKLGYLFIYSNPSSFITYGILLLLLYGLVCIIHTLFLFRENISITRLFGFIGIFLGIMLHGSNGLIVALGKRGVLWYAFLMPPLFLISAVVSGIGLIILIMIVRERLFSSEKIVNRELIFDLGNLLAWTIFANWVLAMVYISIWLNFYPGAYEMVMLISEKTLLIYFAIIGIFLGFFVPMMCLLLPGKSTLSRVIIASLCSWIGIFFMDYVVVIGSQGLALS